ncbi:putative extracellular ribonuclease [Flavobacterium sp. 9AF]|uniref:endonuclease n=1 Tax=Flavobacterium sp. 9AF TaxID=2653142 RepID=UPI0012F173C3|nr:endonuclease [Flavobacterium sp. 9AF]VXB87391.1 putative extracellular ribonuclease [Flavobacterium sp. 9AF]
MKNKITLLLLLFLTYSFSQIPAGYYDSATGTGYALKTQLKKIIDDNNDGLPTEYLHIDRGYGSGTSTTNNGLWTAYGTTDRDMGIGYENDNTIVDMYSENPAASDSYNFNYNTALGANNGQCGTYSNEGDCYNREHLVPQAYFDHYQVNPMKNDPNFVIPTDGKVNGIRDNYPFGVVNIASYTSQNGSKLGSNLNSGYSSGYTGTVFEPIDEFKGDIARCILYFATRYEDLMDNFYTGASVQSKNMFDGSTNKVFSNTFLNILLKWHLQDPVSTKEINRNNAIFVFQNNRNPYIDHPEYVCQIWSSQCAVLSSENFASLDGLLIYPNPTNNNTVFISSPTSLKEMVIYNINGQIVQEIKNLNTISNETYQINNLNSGFYMVKVASENATITKKIIVN